MPRNLTQHAPDLSETEARQGAWGQDVFWVLLASSVLAAIAVGAAWVFQAFR